MCCSKYILHPPTNPFCSISCVSLTQFLKLWDIYSVLCQFPFLEEMIASLRLKFMMLLFMLKWIMLVRFMARLALVLLLWKNLALSTILPYASVLMLSVFRLLSAYMRSESSHNLIHEKLSIDLFYCILSHPDHPL